MTNCGIGGSASGTACPVKHNTRHYELIYHERYGARGTAVAGLKEYEMEFDLHELKIGVIGLGYVGLPLAVEFGKRLELV